MMKGKAMLLLSLIWDEIGSFSIKMLATSQPSLLITENQTFSKLEKSWNIEYLMVEGFINPENNEPTMSV